MWQNKVRILIVDDNSNDLHFIKSALEKGGYRTFLLKRGDQVLKFIKSHTVHAVIIDVMLPAKDGVSLAQEIQNEAHFKGPIFFISGVFKESQFIKTALNKTQAKYYFEKPFQTEDLLKKLNTYLEDLAVDIPAATELYNLLSREFSSHEKKIRALEQMRIISGLDFLCVLSMLIDTKESGFINISCSKGLLGITLYKGQIALFLSLNSLSDLKQKLLQEEYLLEEDYKNLEPLNSSDFIKEVLNLQCTSPHIFGDFLEKEIEKDLQTLTKEKTLKYNFVHHPSMTYKGTLFKKYSFTKLIHDLIKNEVSYEELKNFYTDLMDHPIHRRPEFGRENLYLNMPLIQQNKFILEALNERPSLKEILKNVEKTQERTSILTIHFMALIHIITFGSRKKITNIPFFKQTVSKTWENIKGKDPFEVFKYLGANENAKDFIITRHYQKYRDLNHPGLLPINAPEEIKKLAHESLAEVTEAYQILSDKKTRAEMKKKSLKTREEIQHKLKRVIGVIVQRIEKKEFTEALKTIHQSQMEEAYEEIKLYKAWIELKLSEEKKFYKVSNSWQKKLIVLSQDIKKTSIYHFVIGLCYKGLNRISEAKNSFANALKINENFTEAKNELQALPIPLARRKETQEIQSNQKQNLKKSDPPSDIFNMVSNLFKR